jgi:hypothetical protein
MHWGNVWGICGRIVGNVWGICGRIVGKNTSYHCCENKWALCDILFEKISCMNKQTNTTLRTQTIMLPRPYRG